MCRPSGRRAGPGALAWSLLSLCLSDHDDGLVAKGDQLNRVPMPAQALARLLPLGVDDVGQTQRPPVVVFREPDLNPLPFRPLFFRSLGRVAEEDDLEPVGKADAVSLLKAE